MPSENVIPFRYGQSMTAAVYAGISQVCVELMAPEEVERYLKFLERGKMEYVLDIIFHKKEIGIVKLNEKLNEWGGNIYPCVPPKYVTGSNIIFEQVQNVKYYSIMIGEELKNDVIILNLKSDILFDLEYAVNNGDKKLEQNELICFLNELFELSEFYILLVREDEKIKERHRIVRKEEISARLTDSLRWSNPKDVLLFKKSN